MKYLNVLREMFNRFILKFIHLHYFGQSKSFQNLIQSLYPKFMIDSEITYS